MASVCPLAGSDAFVRKLVAKTSRAIIDDVEKLDAIPEDGFIHFQLLDYRVASITEIQDGFIHYQLLYFTQ